MQTAGHSLVLFVHGFRANLTMQIKRFISWRHRSRPGTGPAPEHWHSSILWLTHCMHWSRLNPQPGLEIHFDKIIYKISLYLIMQIKRFNPGHFSSLSIQWFIRKLLPALNECSGKWTKVEESLILSLSFFLVVSFFKWKYNSFRSTA